MTGNLPKLMSEHNIDPRSFKNTKEEKISEKLYPDIPYSNHRKSKMKKKSPADPLPRQCPQLNPHSRPAGLRARRHRGGSRGPSHAPAETRPARGRWNEVFLKFGRKTTNLEFHTL